MITSRGKQSDKEVETFFVHLIMQMPDVHVCHRGIAEVKISSPICHYLAPPWHSPRAQAFGSFFPQALRTGWAIVGGRIEFEQKMANTPLPLSNTLYGPCSFKYTTALWTGKENVILATGSFGQRLLQLVGIFTNQNWIHILIHKLFHIYFMHIDKIYSQQKATQMLREDTVLCLWGTLTKYKCLAPNSK